MILSPPRFRSTITPSVYGLRYEDVSFVTDDGVTITGWFVECDTAENAIILLHGFAVDKSDLLDIAQLFFRNGYSILLFDFRAHGFSGGKYCSLGYYETNDLAAGIIFLKERGIKRIGVMGFSMGGTVALLSAAKNENIRAIISDSAYLSFRSAARDFAKAYYHIPEFPFIPPAVWAAGKRLRIDPDEVNLTYSLSSISPRPIFLIHAEDDKEITISNAHEIFRHSKEPKQLWVLQQAGHLGAYAVHQFEYEHRIVTFFNQWLR